MLFQFFGGTFSVLEPKIIISIGFIRFSEWVFPALQKRQSASSQAEGPVFGGGGEFRLNSDLDSAWNKVFGEFQDFLSHRLNSACLGCQTGSFALNPDLNLRWIQLVLEMAKQHILCWIQAEFRLNSACFPNDPHCVTYWFEAAESGCFRLF